ncbi:Uncharacterised protein [BD1-7 clade bacterium]|uniref:Uncharacterized protein n=1 Tax=BD1-7 clade bacterium TaxID=2029982 RepID=A0A5S9NSF1_9GAMM|nr:Uncharacterised protein [BD1-7 clade bacterium]CAA0093567.1 Uncharacterised protein [BD1-7 clade bacterium]
MPVSKIAYEESLLVLMRYAIRHGIEEDNPSLILSWMSREIRGSEDSADKLWQIYHGQFQLLLDTYADSLVPDHWRSVCLDHINRPLVHMMNIANTDLKRSQVMALFEELRVISHHFH